MPQVIVEQKVEDYKKWREVFDGTAKLRASYGEKSHKIFRNVEKPNEITILFDWDAIHNVLKYAQDETVKAAMKSSGTLIDPILYLADGELPNQ